MDEKTHPRPSELPVRERVAAALQAAARVLGILASKPEVCNDAVPALRLAERWVNGEEISARELYDSMHRFLPHELESGLEGAEQPAHAAIYLALYYTTWHAYSAELESVGTSRSGILPNDICEGSEEVLIECLDYAARAGEVASSEWGVASGE